MNIYLNISNIDTCWGYEIEVKELSKVEVIKAIVNFELPSWKHEIDKKNKTGFFKIENTTPAKWVKECFFALSYEIEKHDKIKLDTDTILKELLKLI